jgi:hypothetical protein
MKITNTATHERNEHWCLGGNPDAIGAQEARGQQELVNSSQLPTRVLHGERKQLEDAGVVFGEVVSGDDLFCHVTLPTGWRLAATDHSMWSHLLDGEGTVRAKIFYKAAFYDRRAHLSLSV